MNLIADSCFWFSLCDPSESDHTEIVSMMDTIRTRGCHIIVVPHPVLYETLCSRMVKKPDQVVSLTRYLSYTQKISDSEYIEEAYRLVEQQATMNNGTASMVDIVIKLIANDPRNNVAAILTKNSRDFSVFCEKRGIPMVACKEILEAI